MDSSSENIKEIVLSGDKLPKETVDLTEINEYGQNLYKKNRDFIREKIPDTWYAIIEPLSGTLIASADAQTLYNYSSERFPGKLFYFVGLLKEN